MIDYSHMKHNTHNTQTPWIYDGLASAGCWESIPHRLRMGEAPSDWKQKAEQEQDPAWFEFLAKHGITFIMTYYSKGFGPIAEAPVREQARRMAATARKFGMRTAAYLSDTVMLESCSLEEPRVTDWLQVNAAGQPIHYGGDQTHRRRGCFNNPLWRAYLKQMIALARDDGFDAVQPDNSIWWPEPEGCRCRVCREKFRAFLMRRFPDPESAFDRFGLNSVAAMEPPVYSIWFQPWDRDDLRNPLIQEWAMFRAESIADFRREALQFVQAQCPNMLLLMSSSGITARNMIWLHGEDHNQTCGLLPVMCTEEPLPCVYEPEAEALGCKVRSMRLARRCGAIMYHNAYSAHEPGAKPEAMLGEGLAFNQGALGSVAAFHWASHAWPEVTDRYVRFLHEHKPLLTRVNGMAETAVWHSSATFAFDGLPRRMAAILMEQTLIQHNVLFDIILDKHLAELGRYRLLILPGSTCMSDAQAQQIIEWVKEGGSLLATDQASSKDQWRRNRPWPALAEAFGWPTGDRMMSQSGEGEYFELQESFRGDATFQACGKGLAAYIPRLEADPGAPQPDNQFYKTFHWNRWKLPANTGDILATIERLGYNQLTTTFPCWVLCELVRLTQVPGLALHMLNYRKNAPVAPASIRLRLPEAWTSSSVKLYSPEWAGDRPAEVSLDNGFLNVSTPEFDSYCVAHIVGHA